MIGIIVACYLASLVTGIAWVAANMPWAGLFSATIGAAGTILHVAEALLGADQDRHER